VKEYFGGNVFETLARATKGYLCLKFSSGRRDGRMPRKEFVCAGEHGSLWD
jgi:hypothetical protein